MKCIYFISLLLFCFDIVILVLTDGDDADGTELPTLRLLASDGGICILRVRVDNGSAMLLLIVSP